MLDAKFVVAALILNMFQHLYYSPSSAQRAPGSGAGYQAGKTARIAELLPEMLGEYILAGFKVAIILAVC